MKKQGTDRRTHMVRMVCLVLAGLMLFSVVGAAVFGQMF